ncbi:MAG: tRNA pseudouridine(55) synthase TruB [Bacilli bacterium]|nr:tRNA pseudouridine(55) synthase TruB [Bacilli bacterium]MBN2877495.1 tRNA pseudouridine(55) synthase TruB [Bacilli bacterium]
MDGVLIIDKPKNYTSHDIVNIARRALGTKRVGHIGTLDPNATGVLVLCINKATKLVKYFEHHSKIYQATFRLGLQTDTDDITGKVQAEGSTDALTEHLVKSALDQFLGKQKQVPPIYSAVKIKGKKLYELARRDLEIPTIEPRDVEIYSIANFVFLENEPGFTFQVDLHVSKGTYIRSIARDLGKQLGVYGTLVELRRTSINKFHIEDAISLEKLEAGEYQIKDPFDYMNLPKVTLEKKQEYFVRNGRFLDPETVGIKEDCILCDETEKPLAIYFYDEQKNQLRMSVKWC